MEEDVNRFWIACLAAAAWVALVAAGTVDWLIDRLGRRR